MSIFLCLKNRRHGFSLIEMLISMVIFSVVMGIIYTFLLQTRRDLSDAELELSLTDNAQSAVNALRKDLYQIGVGRDAEKNQPQILRAGMFDLIFVADVDREIRNSDRRYGSLDPELPMSFVPGSPFRPLYFLYDPAIPDELRYTGWDPDEAYGYRNIGAEIVRYSLDSNTDGVINNLDLENNLLFEGARQRTMNPHDFWLFKEWWGCVKTSTGYANQHSGVHPVAFNLRGMFYNPTGGVTPESVERFKYPNEDYPPVLFTYWGHFWRTAGLPDPGDPDWPGETLKLWGDWGNQNPVELVQPAGPGPDGARNGVLDPHEIQNMLNNPLWAEVNLNYMRYITSHAGESPNGDENGNGIPGENRLDQFIRRIGVNVLIESSDPKTDSPNLPRSDLSNPDNPQYYYYQDYEISIEINPRNLMYEGSPEIDINIMTPSPIPTVTPTPVVTDTPTPGSPTPYIPTVTPTHDPDTTPTPSPTPAPDPFDPLDGQVFISGEGRFFGRTIPHEATSISDVCYNIRGFDYYLPSTDKIVALETAFLCKVHEPWRDLVVATDGTVASNNLYYYSNPQGTGVDEMERVHNNQQYVGGWNTVITHLAAGNLGMFGMVSEGFQEVVVAYCDMSRCYLEVLAMNGQCGDLMQNPLVGDPAEGEKIDPLMLQTGYNVIDMLIADFSNDGKGELAVMLNNPETESTKIRIFKNMDENKWSNSMEIAIEAQYIDGVPFNASKLVSGVVYSTQPYYGSDLIVVAENGHFIVFKNEDMGNSFTGHIADPGVFKSLFSSIADTFVYDAQINDPGEYYPVLVISGLSLSGTAQIVHYDMKDKIDYIPVHLDSASGDIGASHASLTSLAYVPIKHIEQDVTWNYLVATLQIGTSSYMYVIKEPVFNPSPDIRDVTCNGGPMIPASVESMVSTYNAISQY
jgi:prepilin-type N-terminal cleavage/methylation domain-containing protein